LFSIVGVLEGKQTENGRNERNDRKSLSQSTQVAEAYDAAARIDKELTKSISDFFVSYNALQGRNSSRLGCMAGNELCVDQKGGIKATIQRVGSIHVLRQG